MKLTIANVDFKAVIAFIEAKYEGKPKPQRDGFHSHYPPDAKLYNNQDLALALEHLYGGYNGLLFCEMRRILKQLGWWNTNHMCND